MTSSERAPLPLEDFLDTLSRSASDKNSASHRFCKDSQPCGPMSRHIYNTVLGSVDPDLCDETVDQQTLLLLENFSLYTIVSVTNQKKTHTTHK